jgi:hypothetical protein
MCPNLFAHLGLKHKVITVQMQGLVFVLFDLQQIIQINAGGIRRELV